MNDIFTVGFEKGEADFGVSSEVTSLNFKQMNDLRAMITVAIGTMEEMWRREQEKKHPASSNSEMK